MKNVTGKNDVQDILAQFIPEKSSKELTDALGDGFK